MSWIGGDGEGGAGIHIIKSMNHQIDCLGKKKKKSPNFKALFPPLSPLSFQPVEEHTCYYGINFFSKEENKDGHRGHSKCWVSFLKTKVGYAKAPQTNQNYCWICVRHSKAISEKEMF